jgi:hypothetical protein
MGTRKIGYKMNVGLSFFISTMCLVLLITSSFYYFVRKQLYSEIIADLKSTVSIGADTIDTDAFKILTAKLSSGNISPKEQATIEKSSEFIAVYNQLNRIRDSKNGLILYVYTIVPGIDGNHARFVVDADVLKDKINKINPDEISEFGEQYDISSQPVTRKALVEKLNIVNTKYVFDKKYGVNSVMGFAPVYDKKTKEYVGTLGADISDKNIAIFLNKIIISSLIVTVLAIILIIGLTIFLAGSVSKPIMNLSEIVQRFSNREYDVREKYLI